MEATRQLNPERATRLNRWGQRRTDPAARATYKLVSVRVLKPFRYREVTWRNGVAVPLSDSWIAQPGEVLTEVIEPEARSWPAAGKVELVE